MSPWCDSVVTNDARLISVNRLSGKVRWINQLPAFERPKKKQGQIDYSGPVLAGGRLVLVGSNGVVVNIDPVTGSFQSQTRNQRLRLFPLHQCRRHNPFRRLRPFRFRRRRRCRRRCLFQHPPLRPHQPRYLRPCQCRFRHPRRARVRRHPARR